MEAYGFKKGALKKAPEQAMMRFMEPGKADWSVINGVSSIDIA